jgi:hypothetical protein
VFTKKKKRAEVVPKKPKKIDPTAGMEAAFANAGIGIVRQENPAFFGGYAPMNMMPPQASASNFSQSSNGADTPRSQGSRRVIQPRPVVGPIPA